MNKYLDSLHGAKYYEPPASRSFSLFAPHPSRNQTNQNTKIPPLSISMAYPFPPFFTAPQTPLQAPDMKSPPILGNSNPVVASKRTAFTVILAIALFFWMISTFSGPPRQLDRVPFSHDSVEEYVMYLCSTTVLLTNPATSYIFKDIDAVASNQHNFMCLHSHPTTMPSSILSTATTVQHFWRP